MSVCYDIAQAKAANWFEVIEIGSGPGNRKYPTLGGGGGGGGGYISCCNYLNVGNVKQSNVRVWLAVSSEKLV